MSALAIVCGQISAKDKGVPRGKHPRNICGFVAKFPSYLKRHQLKHEEGHQYECEACGTKFKTSSAYYMHLREKHANEQHICQICGAGFSQKRTLERHILIHLDDKPFACDRCGYTCRRKQDLIRHVHAMHSGKVRRKAHEERIADVHIANSIHTGIYNKSSYVCRQTVRTHRLSYQYAVGLVTLRSR